MSQVMSKLVPIGVSCHTYVHPWTSSCSEASIGLFLHAIYYSLRIYATVYTGALLMRGRLPTLTDLKKTLSGILQSTAFLSFTAFGYAMFACLLRRIFGQYNILTISFMPSFLSNVMAILIERPSRRALLALYVSNIATETLWNMAKYREMVKPVNKAPVLIFSASVALLLTYFRTGWHKRKDLEAEKKDDRNDGMFNILKFAMGPYEEYGYNTKRSMEANITNQSHRPSDTELQTIASTATNAPSTSTSPIGPRRTVKNVALLNALRAYKRIINQVKCGHRSNVCPHPFSCIYYTVQGSAKMFSIGLALQAGLRAILNIGTLFKTPQRFGKLFMKRDVLSIAFFLGGSCGLFRSILCMLRHVSGKDSPYYAAPAGLIAGLAFNNYPDTTVALYVFWKMLQITYNMGIDNGIVPEVPGFTSFLYCFSTAILFHAALVEPQNLRPSYWKFLHAISGGRVAMMGREAMDVWGLDTSRSLARVLTKNRTQPVLKYFFFK